MIPDPTFNTVFVVFAAIFALVLLIVLASIVKGAAQWASDKAAPMETSPARVVAKRTDVHGYTGINAGGTTSTTYYCTFEMPTGQRREFRVSGQQFGVLVEGDGGTLASQGSRFVDFQRG